MHSLNLPAVQSWRCPQEEFTRFWLISLAISTMRLLCAYKFFDRTTKSDKVSTTKVIGHTEYSFKIETIIRPTGGAGAHER
jgi:hypothetical protein